MNRSQPLAAAIVIFSLSLAAIQPALAVTAAERNACRADAYRLCKSVLSNDAKRHACMHAHAAQLSKGCIAAALKSR